MRLKLLKKMIENLLQLIIYIYVIHITNITLSKFNRHKESHSILHQIIHYKIIFYTIT